MASLFFFRFEGAALGAAMLAAHCICNRSDPPAMSDMNIMFMVPVVWARVGVWRDFGAGRSSDGGDVTAGPKGVLVSCGKKTNWAAPVSAADKNSVELLLRCTAGLGDVSGESGSSLGKVFCEASLRLLRRKDLRTTFEKKLLVDFSPSLPTEASSLLLRRPRLLRLALA